MLMLISGFSVLAKECLVVFLHAVITLLEAGFEWPNDPPVSALVICSISGSPNMQPSGRRVICAASLDGRKRSII